MPLTDLQVSTSEALIELANEVFKNLEFRHPGALKEGDRAIVLRAMTRLFQNGTKNPVALRAYGMLRGSEMVAAREER
jgi:hypothetical protein